ncbi:hypothetical protein [Hymenobacter terrenus]|uniref:hypothetical protein n=1 Tax=Hymenobacter terrenus TaxID=1629124 RepID=UPI00061973BA|nr:hypothetical protein [Hymenobacter terrenus]
MRYLFPLFLILSCLLTFLPGCEPKEDMVQTSGSLEMGADTVLFDTVFTTVRTVTKRLWVYNRNSGAVKTNVSLTGTAGNTFDLIINGDTGPTANDVTIRGKDSLLVLVRAILGDNGTSTKPFLITDEVHFRTNGNDQNVKLVAYGQNAYFHDGEILPCNSVWRNDKPHVIYNSVQVNAGCVLRILPGTRVYLHAGSGILVKGRILVNAGSDFPVGSGPTDTIKATNRNIVRFLGDRREPFYDNIPGQWLGIQMDEGSTGNIIRYAEIKNASFGVLLYNPENRSQPDVTLDNTVIQNISGNNLSFASGGNTFTGAGIFSFSGKVTATNCLLTNCGEYAVLGLGGGTYDFNFCTFANYTPSFRRETSSITFTNEKATDARVLLPTSVTIRNSIVWGSFEDELFVKNYTDPNYTVSIRNSLVRTKEYATTPAVVGNAGVNIINTDPLFKRTSLSGSQPDYSLQATSPAGAIRSAPATPLPSPFRDLLNLPRSSQPTIGAYEFNP